MSKNNNYHFLMIIFIVFLWYQNRSVP